MFYEHFEATAIGLLVLGFVAVVMAETMYSRDESELLGHRLGAAFVICLEIGFAIFALRPPAKQPWEQPPKPATEVDVYHLQEEINRLHHAVTSMDRRAEMHQLQAAVSDLQRRLDELETGARRGLAASLWRTIAALAKAAAGNAEVHRIAAEQSREDKEKRRGRTQSGRPSDDPVDQGQSDVERGGGGGGGAAGGGDQRPDGAQDRPQAGDG